MIGLMWNYWEEIYSWKDIDHIKMEKWRTWYIVFILLICFSVIWGIIEGIYSMSALFLGIGLFYLYISNQDPHEQVNKLTTSGLVYGEQFAPYSDMNCFWIIYYKNVHFLHIKHNSMFHLDLVIPIIEWDSWTIRDILIWRNIKELDWMKESLDEAISRKLKM